MLNRTAVAAALFVAMVTLAEHVQAGYLWGYLWP